MFGFPWFIVMETCCGFKDPDVLSMTEIADKNSILKMYVNFFFSSIRQYFVVWGVNTGSSFAFVMNITVVIRSWICVQMRTRHCIIKNYLIFVVAR